MERIGTMELPTLILPPDFCADPAQSFEREWLVTNGLGGYASGTVGGALTRRYHGLLVAALRPPVARTLLLARLDETVQAGGATYPLGANEYADGAIDPHGYALLHDFALEGSV